MVGHWRGGLGHASVVSSMVFAGVSGSSVADTSAIGSILVPAMKDHGYKPGFAAALVACAGTIGAIIPPSMTMIVYGSMANVSIGGLFLGGIVPGILIGIGLMIVIRIYSLAPGFPELRETTGKFTLRGVATATVKVWPALLAPGAGRRRHPDRGVHRDRGRRRRLLLRLLRRLLHLPAA